METEIRRSDLDLHCLPMSQKRMLGLYRLNFALLYTLRILKIKKKMSELVIVLFIEALPGVLGNYTSVSDI